MEYIHTSHYQVSHSPFRACYWHTHEGCNVVLVKSARVISVIVGSTIEFPSVRLASSITVTVIWKKQKNTGIVGTFTDSATRKFSMVQFGNHMMVLNASNKFIWNPGLCIYIYVCVYVYIYIYIPKQYFSPLFAVPCKNTTNFNFQLQTWWLCLKHRRGPLWHHHRMKCFPLCFKHWWSDFSQCVISNLGNLVCVFFFPCNNYIPVSDKTYYFF